MGNRLALAALAALLVPSAAQAEDLAAAEMTRDTLPANAEDGRIETTTADLAAAIGVWTGVRSCSDGALVQSRLQAAFDSWIGQQTMARPGKLLLTYGWQQGSWWYENRKRGGKRSCKGGFHSIPVYAHFY